MSALNSILEAYGDLERRVQQRITRRWGGVCAHCATSCCRVDICEEALESVFLCRVREHFDQPGDFDPRFGWLGPGGCRLEVGRPPVCYAFFCDEIRNSLTPEAREQLDRLGSIMDRVGRVGPRGLHLVELTDPGDLEEINLDRFLSYADRARRALHGAGP
ncbi:hypothetical protein [Kiritimatiella glycovorans]|uniref:hypothetical protein n=1 Tax=Kiritimatiella glycovorans TaxID=1307763 RepID=UPI001187338C|nr:hypothetical protein [Kiritimatiella glycovorans]